MSRPVWFVELLKKVFFARFLLARLTRLPIIGHIADHLLFKGDSVFFLPQDRVIPVGESIDPPGETVLPSQVVEHFIEEAQVHWIMDFCICRAGNQCQDYPIGLGCLFLGEAASGINPQLGRRVTKEEALEHVQRCREAGLVHMIGRNKIDEIWLGVRPGERLLTICHCCPCCCLWGVLPQLNHQISAKVARMPGVTLTVGEGCIGCGACAQKGVCFVDAIRIVDGRAVISESCRGCGRCVDVCPQGAIRIAIEYDHSVRTAIDHISSAVDVS